MSDDCPSFLKTKERAKFRSEKALKAHARTHGTQYAPSTSAEDEAAIARVIANCENLFVLAAPPPQPELVDALDESELRQGDEDGGGAPEEPPVVAQPPKKKSTQYGVKKKRYVFTLKQKVAAIQAMDRVEGDLKKELGAEKVTKKRVLGLVAKEMGVSTSTLDNFMREKACIVCCFCLLL
jgi:hypothetical protein